MKIIYKKYMRNENKYEIAIFYDKFIFYQTIEVLL